MSLLAPMPAKHTAVFKRSAAYAELLWAKWPTPEAWPGTLNVYEAAAYKRVGYRTIWQACQKGSDGKARLSHQRFGQDYRIAKAALDRFGLVQERAA